MNGNDQEAAREAGSRDCGSGDRSADKEECVRGLDIEWVGTIGGYRDLELGCVILLLGLRDSAVLVEWIKRGLSR